MRGAKLKRALDYFLNDSKLVNFLAVGIILVGVFVLLNIKKDLHPPFDSRSIVVTAELPSASATEIERLIATPLEDALRSLPNLKSMRSTSSAASVRIEMDFPYSVENMLEVVEEARQKIEEIGFKLPQNVRKIRVEQNKTREIYLASYVFLGLDSKNDQHRMAVKKIERKLSTSDGVARVDAYIPGRDIFIEIDQQKLKMLELTILQVRKAISDNLTSAPVANLYFEDGGTVSVSLSEPKFDLKKLRDIPIESNRTGQSIRLEDLAKVDYKLPPESMVWLYYGDDAVWIQMFKSVEGDSFSTLEKLNKKIEEAKKDLPEGVTLVSVGDGPQFLLSQLSVLKTNGVVGFLLVLIVLMLFLSFRVALITAWGIPLAYAGTLLLMNALGMAVDLLTLIGMIVVVGILVDDAIIVSERYTTLRSEGLGPYESARQASRELIVPVSGTILTTIAAFLPVLFLKSSMTQFLAPIPIVIGAALIVSWFESFFLLPNHLAHFVKTPPRDRSKRLFESFRRVYTNGLQRALRFRYLVLLGSLLFIVGSGWVVAKKLQHSFNISIGSEQVRVYFVLKHTESLAQTRQLLQPMVSSIVESSRDVSESIFVPIGGLWRNGEEFKGPQYGQVIVNIDAEALWPSRVKKKLVESLNEISKGWNQDIFEEIAIEERKRGDEGVAKNLVSVTAEGSDAGALRKFREEISQQNLSGITYYKDRSKKSTPQWIFYPDEAALAKYNITRSDLTQSLAPVFTPSEVSRQIVNDEEVVLYLETQGANERAVVENIDTIKIMGKFGRPVSLNQLGHWELHEELKELKREGGSRIEQAQFEFDSATLNAESAKLELAKLVDQIKDRFAGLNVRVEDGNRSETENRNWSLEVLATCLVLVLTILFLTFRSLTTGMIVALPIPLAVSGVFWVLWAHGHTLTIMSIIGLLGVIGVAVNDSIVMVHRIREVSRGKPTFREAVVTGAPDRLRAIFLTSVTTWAGVFPTAYGLFGESATAQPITFSLGWGLVVSTLSTLFVLPCFLVVNDESKTLLSRAVQKIVSRFKSPSAAGLVVERPARGRPTSGVTEGAATPPAIN
ncbi:MAG: hypothetical protein COT74_02555 [Bdellovibrionales bacterium CG10_big_fil_rev_8_21_14_0_10_45_34]|nr:MAG: hypothetical protein COT74_02555 [Bdellovibrionales bacterium CG10_big_fil_rev_8_21_14_0_10_45_34]